MVLQEGTQVTQGSVRVPIVLSMILALVMAVQAVLGLVLPGLYRDTGYVSETWFGNDLVTLVLALPLLVVGLLVERRGTVLGRLLWLGGLGYAIYNYAFYLFGAALNAFFLLYVAAFLLAVAAMVLGLSRTSAHVVAAAFSPRTPAKPVGGYLMFAAAGLTVVWLAMWAGYVFAGRPTPGSTEAFKIVAALDLTVMVPALALGGCLLWRRHPSGYVIAALASVQGALYLTVLALNGALFIVRGLAEAPGELPVWGSLSVATAVAAVLLLSHVRRSEQAG
jgi:hypothetical protein